RRIFLSSKNQASVDGSWIRRIRFSHVARSSVGRTTHACASGAAVVVESRSVVARRADESSRHQSRRVARKLSHAMGGRGGHRFARPIFFGSRLQRAARNGGQRIGILSRQLHDVFERTRDSLEPSLRNFRERKRKTTQRSRIHQEKYFG